jgi:transcriptional regulator
MFVPPSFAVDDDQAWAIVAAAGAGVLVHHGANGLASVVVPFVIGEDRTTLTTHVAKANEWWRDVVDGDEVLVLFLAASGYVSPSYYPSRLTGTPHVPTWNYVATEVRGTVTLSHERAWLADQTRALTDQFEEGRTPPWSVDDTSSDYLERQYGGIVGVTVRVTAITGKAKLSQNRVEGDRAEVRASLAQGTAPEQGVAQWMQP